MKKSRRLLSVLLVTATLTTGAQSAAAGPSTPAARGVPAPAAPAPPKDLSTIPTQERDGMLPSGWRQSDDLLWTTAGDSTGFHLLVAEASTGYTWRTAATLAEAGFVSEQWIGNACVSGSGKKAAVVYAPRSFVNKQEHMDRGGFTAVVDLTTGNVQKLPVQSSLSYFSPGCGAAEGAVFTQAGDQDLGKTRLVKVDLVSGAPAKPVELSGQVTSAVPTRSGMAAAWGHRIATVSPDGEAKLVVETTGTPTQLQVDREDGISFLDHGRDEVVASRLHERSVRPLARAARGKLGLRGGKDGQVFLTGFSQAPPPGLPPVVTAVRSEADVQLSTTGRAVITKTALQRLSGPELTSFTPATFGQAEPVRIEAKLLDTDRQVGFTVDPAERVSPHSATGGLPSPALGVGGRSMPGRPTDSGFTCSVPRNDSRSQAYQPTPHQVEWAVNMIVVDGLEIHRPSNWKQSGLPAYSPGQAFKPAPLAGGGRIPAQVLLGILAQESNMWQASRYVPEGLLGQPLIGSFYGVPHNLRQDDTKWTINFKEADCGYGIGQVTDGMRKKGSEKPGEVARPEWVQRAIALDYVANIAVSAQILADKWNQMAAQNMKVNNGDPARVENWFFATWAYNSGFNPDKGDGSAWGLGWQNNPVNPRYPTDRRSFLDGRPSDAARPQDWSYPEKIMGWAAHSIGKDSGKNGAGYRPAWWLTPGDRTTVQPPRNTFCDQSNNCEFGKLYVPKDPSILPDPAKGEKPEPPGPCNHVNPATGLIDLKCWYHQSGGWKGDCEQKCGREFIRFDYPEYKAEWKDETSSPPNCSRKGLPGNALVIDDAPEASQFNPDCLAAPGKDGTFNLDFATDNGKEFSKVDFHQVGGGYNGHYYFANTRSAAKPEYNRMTVTGTWTLNQPLDRWTRVLVHMPSENAQTPEAWYTVNLGNGQSKRRSLLQRTAENKWVSLGVFKFDGVPSVSLNNRIELTQEKDHEGMQAIAWDAIAFQPLDAKPRHQIVALGDSYSSGEGASALNGSDYYKETDNNGGNWRRNACHRSPHAWSRKAVLRDDDRHKVGQRADEWDPNIDYHLLACSGAETEHIFSSRPVNGITYKNAWGEGGSSRYREPSQLDRGFVDENTTLVTMSIGGNDAKFGPIMEKCIINSVWSLHPCQTLTLDGDDKPLSEAEADRIFSQVIPSISSALQNIHALAPKAQLILMGYPVLMERQTSCIPHPVGPGTTAWIADTTRYLASESQHLVNQLSQKFPVAFANPISQFEGKGACGSPEEIHSLVLTKTPGDGGGPVSAQSFHPKIGGTQLYANALNTTLEKLGL